MRAFLLLLALSFVFTGCPRPLDENGERRKDVEAREAAQRARDEQASGARGVEIVADTLHEDDASRRLTSRIGYPVVQGNAPGIEAVNEQLALVAGGLANEMAPEEPLGPEASEYERYEFWGGFDVEYASEQYVSLLQTLWAYTGGAHGNTYFSPQTYDLQTGRLLALADVLSTDADALETLRASVIDALVRQAMARTGDTEEGARESLWFDDLTATPEAFENRWTMGTDSLALHFAPYEVSAYAYGTWRVPVAYSDLAPHLGPVTARLTAE